MRTEAISNPLKLTSDGSLVLHFIGTGSAFTKKNYQNNLVLVKKDSHLVVDFGTKASQGLFEKGIKVADIDGYLITHVHADHIGSLEEAALIGRYFTKKRPDLIIPDILEKPLWEHSLKGGLAYNEKPALKLADLFNVIYPKEVKKFGRPAYKIAYKGFDLVIFKTNHIPGTATLEQAAWASGIIIDKRILFTADTKFDLEMLETFDKAFNLELFIHDCQFFTGGVHASLEELKALPEHFKKRMLLTHYADNWEQFHPEQDGFLGFTKPDLYYIFD
jgi:ribonuclease BN (tRNA processing enzyme)